MKAIAYGRAVSMETVLISIVVVDGIAATTGKKVSWDKAYVEPAVFAMEDDRGDCRISCSTNVVHGARSRRTSGNGRRWRLF